MVDGVGLVPAVQKTLVVHNTNVINYYKLVITDPKMTKQFSHLLSSDGAVIGAQVHRQTSYQVKSVTTNSVNRCIQRQTTERQSLFSSQNHYSLKMWPPMTRKQLGLPMSEADKNNENKPSSAQVKSEPSLLSMKNHREFKRSSVGHGLNRHQSPSDINHGLGHGRSGTHEPKFMMKSSQHRDQVDSRPSEPLFTTSKPSESSYLRSGYRQRLSLWPRSTPYWTPTERLKEPNGQPVVKSTPIATPTPHFEQIRPNRMVSGMSATRRPTAVGVNEIGDNRSVARDWYNYKSIRFSKY